MRVQGGWCLAVLVLVGACSSSSGPFGKKQEEKPADCTTLGCGAGLTCDAASRKCLCGTVECGATQRCDALAQVCVTQLTGRCTPGSGWTPGTQAFREATGTWGLDTLHVEGTRITSADVDGDGYQDLFVRRTGTVSDDFGPGPDGGPRVTWLLHNAGGQHFEDVTEASGLVAQRTAGATANRGRPAEITIFGDVDNDGDVDAFTAVNVQNAATQPETTELMLNNGDGTFVLGPEDSPVRRAGEAAGRAAASFVDANRDGALDLWIGNGTVNNEPTPAEFYLGAADATFRNATVESGLATRPWSRLADLNNALSHANSWSSLACDLNNDGAPELLTASYGRAPNLLFVGIYDNGTTIFDNRSVSSGYAFDERVDWSDNESARCWCKLHRTNTGCADIPLPTEIRCNTDADAFRWNHSTDRAPYRLGGNSGTTVCADVNNDGNMDLLTTEIVHWDVGSSSDPSELLLNTGEPEVRFTRPGNEVTGLTRVHTLPDWNDGDITGAVFDFDNDMRPDIYIGSTDYSGTRGLLFWQAEDHTFVPVPVDVGIDHRSSHGIAVADFDRDGDLDVVVGHSRSRCTGGDHCYPTATTRYFENVLGSSGNWVQLHLVGGPSTNRSAIGARVSVTAGGVTQTQEVGGGHGHYGMQQDLVLHFGLGANCVADVTVRWPDAALTTQTFQVQAGYRFSVAQGSLPVVAP